MAVLDTFQQMVTENASEVDFLTIYIEESHALDGWRFYANYHQIKKHKKLEERIAAAKLLELNNPTYPIVVDPMTDEANRAYGGLYERLYVIMDGIIMYQGARGPRGYHIEEVQDWIRNYKRKSPNGSAI